MKLISLSFINMRKCINLYAKQISILFNIIKQIDIRDNVKALLKYFRNTLIIELIIRSYL